MATEIEVVYEDGTRGVILWPSADEIQQQEEIFREVWEPMREETERLIDGQ